ncbi:hypothetical protein P9273_09560 [Mesorhizobium sp. WSM4935]|uniref:hypothetical protein n=1 Tax=Mesorhizobium sp. WSM4935 TaxID=3038547 RepID=UPI0024155AC7|nr:hypothetical protein [Mesorhizobium sp. WSM4935]MDG4875342.1 hypothetical protein [Mesorhizobium sp. WSM4935]
METSLSAVFLVYSGVGEGLLHRRGHVPHHQPRYATARDLTPFGSFLLMGLAAYAQTLCGNPLLGYRREAGLDAIGLSCSAEGKLTCIKARSSGPC